MTPGLPSREINNELMAEYVANLTYSWRQVSYAAGSPFRFLTANPKRYCFVVLSLVAASQYIGLDSTVSATKGVFIGNGSYFEPKISATGTWVTSEWWAFCPSGSPQLVVFEFTVV